MKTSNINNVTIEEVTNLALVKELEEKLKSGPAHFIFKKKDGSKREAFGTVNPDLFTKFEGVKDKIDEETKDHIAGKKAGVTVYYDLQQMGWRSLVSENLIVVF